MTLRHKEFSGSVGEAPLSLREGASLNPVNQAGFDFKLGKSEEYTCGINAAWVPGLGLWFPRSLLSGGMFMMYYFLLI